MSGCRAFWAYRLARSSDGSEERRAERELDRAKSDIGFSVLLPSRFIMSQLDKPSRAQDATGDQSTTVAWWHGMAWRVRPA